MAGKVNPSTKWPKREPPFSVRFDPDDRSLVYEVLKRAGEESVHEGRRVTMREVVAKALRLYLKTPLSK